MKYRIGLHLDNDKIGWAVINENEQGEACHLERMGVRFFPVAENPFNGAAPSVERRMYRLTRRRYARIRYRFSKLRELFEQVGLPPVEKLVHKPVDYLWQLRTEGLERLLTPEEWVHVLYHIAHHRGFQYEGALDSSATLCDGAKMRKSILENQQQMEKYNYRTVGELFYRDVRFRPNGVFTPFKTGQPYITCVTRDMIRDEVVLLFYTQLSLGNPFATEAFEQKYTEILCRQRHIMNGPGPNSPYARHKRRISGIYCPLEPQHECCPTATPLAERFHFLCMVNAPYSISASAQVIKKTDEQKRKIRAACTKNPSGVLAATRKVLHLDPNTPLTLYLNGNAYSASAVKDFVTPHGRQLRTTLSKQFPDEQGILHKHWEKLLIMFVATPNNQWKKQLKAYGFSKELCEALINAHLIKRDRYSRKAIGHMLPFLEKGLSADEARDKAYPDNPFAYNGSLNFKNFYHVARPITDRVLSQSIVLIKALIREYGMPTTIQFSTSYSMGAPMAIRKKYTRTMAEYEKSIHPFWADAKEILQRDATNDEKTRIALWYRQKKQCIYTGTELTLDQALSPTETFVDHIIPYADSYDHSPQNLVLVLRSAADNRTALPGALFGMNEDFRHRAYSSVHRKTRRYLLTTKWSEQDSIDQKQRSLYNSSSLLSSFAVFLQRTLSASSDTAVTVSSLKTRIIGLRTERVFDNVPTAMEPAANAILTAIIDTHICEQLSIFFMDNYENTLFQPWNSLQEEFDSLCASDSQCYSHMSQHRVRGAAHRDTILRSRGDQVVAKVPLAKLKLNDDFEITDYFQPERDRLLYTALRKQLLSFGGNAAEAFAEPFYKPKSNGLRGPLVKSVPIIQHPRNFVSVRDGIGINGDMIRIDVFRTPDQAYYFVPIYVKDTLQDSLPLRAATKNPDRMLLMEEHDFIFALYQNDVIYIELPEAITLKSTTSSDSIEVDHGYFLRGKVRSKSGTFEIATLDKQYTRTSIPFFSLSKLYKCEVAPLGTIRKITKPEKRMEFHLK